MTVKDVAIREEIKKIIENVILKEHIDYNSKTDIMTIKSKDVQVYYQKAITLIDACIDNEDNELMEAIEKLNYTKIDILVILGFIDIGLFDLFNNEEHLEHFIDIMDLYITFLDFKSNNE